MIFRKSDYQKANADLAALERDIERLVARAAEIDQSIAQGNARLGQIQEQLDIQTYTDAPLAEIEASSKATFEEKTRLDIWIDQQTAISKRIALDIAGLKLRVPAIERRVENAQCDWYNKALVDAQRDLWLAVRPIIGPLVRMSRLQRVVLNHRRKHDGVTPLLTQSLADIWTDCYEGLRKAALAEGLDIETTQVVTDVPATKGEPSAAPVESPSLTSIDRAVFRKYGVLTKEEFVTAVAARIEASKPKIPSLAECRDQIVEWSGAVKKIEDKLAELEAQGHHEPRELWRDGDLPGQSKGLPTEEHSRARFGQERAALRYRLDRARKTLQRWRDTLAQQSSNAA